jgi:proteasome beta subunit
MAMPFFPPSDDPGSNFPDLLRRIGHASSPSNHAGGDATSAGLNVPHATTCVAMRFADGVVMAGDRRATAGNLISHRTMEKVVQADRFSGVAIAGSAGPAMEMIKLFALQLEHYEKVEGSSLSLEGKANQLSMMVRGNLPAAMQGFVVVPLFAGYDTRRRIGRLWSYDATGGRYEELDQIATGSGSLHASTVVKVGYRDGMSRDEAIDLACHALWEAADADSATGGPDPLRGIYPVVATITADGWQRVSDQELEDRYAALAADLRSRTSRGPSA